MVYDCHMGIEHLDFEPGDPDDELPPNPDEAPKKPVGWSPAQQEREVPLGWKPTLDQPVPVMRCVQVKKDGERCKSWSLRGYHKCKRHAGPGALMPDGNVNKYREAVIEAAKLRLLDDAEDALDTLEQLRQPGTGEAIRLKAATEVLDRAGIRGGFEIQVDIDINESPADEIRKRLDELKKGADTVKSLREADIVEGEIIEDDADQLQLPFDDDESTDLS